MPCPQNIGARGKGRDQTRLSGLFALLNIRAAGPFHPASGVPHFRIRPQPIRATPGDGIDHHLVGILMDGEGGGENLAKGMSTSRHTLRIKIEAAPTGATPKAHIHGNRPALDQATRRRRLPPLGAPGRCSTAACGTRKRACARSAGPIKRRGSNRPPARQANAIKSGPADNFAH